MSHPADGYAARKLARTAARLALHGTDILLLSGSVTVRCQVKGMGATAIEKLELESGVSLAEMNPLVLDKLPLDFPGEVGDFLLYPANGSAANDRYRIHSIAPPVQFNGTPIKIVAVAVADPDRS